MNTNEREMLGLSKVNGWSTLDDYLTTLCLDRTMGQIYESRDKAHNVRSYFGSALLFTAVFEHDIGLLEEIIKRIDGTVPDKDERDGYANLIGGALEDVMDQPIGDQQKISPDDTAIIAMAKTILWIATQDSVEKSDGSFRGLNSQEKKDRQKAVEIVLSRTGGRRSEPVKEITLIEYQDPDWMSLPSGGE